MRRLTGIALGLAILAGPTSTAQAVEPLTTFSGGVQSQMELPVLFAVSNASEADSAPSSVIPPVNPGAGEVIILSAWVSSGLILVLGLAFLPGALSKGSKRRKQVRDLKAETEKEESTFPEEIESVQKSLDDLDARVAQEATKYGEPALHQAWVLAQQAREAWVNANSLKDGLPIAKKKLEDVKARLAHAGSVTASLTQAKWDIVDGHACIDALISSEKALEDLSVKISSQIDELNGMKDKMKSQYETMSASFDHEYISGLKNEMETMEGCIENAKKSSGELVSWLEQHNLQIAEAASVDADNNIASAISSYRAFNSRVVAISSFDLSRDAAITGMMAQLDANIPENRAEGMPRIIGDARNAVKNARKLDTKSGNPAKALEEILRPVEAYKDAVSRLEKRKKTTEAMKRSVFAAMEEAKVNHEILLSDMQRYGITPTAEERSSLERVDAVLIHNFAKIRYDASSLPLFDVERIAAWSGNALKTIMTAKSQASGLAIRVKREAERKAEEKRKHDEAERQKKKKRQEEERRKKRRDEDDRRRKRNMASSSSYSGGGSDF